MLRYFTFLAAFLGGLSVCHAQEVFFQDAFSAGSLQGWQGSGTLETYQDHGQVLHLTQPPAAQGQSATMTIALPVEKMRGSSIFFAADVAARNVSPKPRSWNGIKLMLIVQTPAKTDYPQADLGVGDVAWKHCAVHAPIPEDATAVTLVLGLEKVSGDAWFRNVRVTLRKRIAPLPAADPAKPIYRGHDLPRLRGAMVPNTLQESDLTDFAENWHANLIRWQLVQHGSNPPTLEAYDAWLDSQLAKLDQVLAWCQNHHVRVVVDLHSPPGGEIVPGTGYVGAAGRIFALPEAQRKFLDTWKKIAARYQGRDVIWGFDLMNEPVDKALAEGCDDWQDLALKAARVVHAIDPQRTIIVEPAGWGGPAGFATFLPLDEPRVVYSFHMYEPGDITHQGILGHPAGPTYPGVVHGKTWDKAALEQAMKPAFDFAQRYRVHLFAGEFSCIRTAPGATAVNYLRDVIDILEAHDVDWTYHAFREWQGWSVEHEGPLTQPTLAAEPNPRELLLKQWFAQNQQP
jgi:hypothetical protein